MLKQLNINISTNATKQQTFLHLNRYLQYSSARLAYHDAGLPFQGSNGGQDNRKGLINRNSADEGRVFETTNVSNK